MPKPAAPIALTTTDEAPAATVKRIAIGGLVVFSSILLSMWLQHTYWPFGSVERHLSNLDSIFHASIPWAVAYWYARRSSPSQRVGGDSCDAGKQEDQPQGNADHNCHTNKIHNGRIDGELG